MLHFFTLMREYWFQVNLQSLISIPLTDFERNFTLPVSQGELLKGKSNLNDFRHEASTLLILNGNAPWVRVRIAIHFHLCIYVKHSARFSLYFGFKCWVETCFVCVKVHVQYQPLLN